MSKKNFTSRVQGYALLAAGVTVVVLVVAAIAGVVSEAVAPEGFINNVSETIWVYAAIGALGALGLAVVGMLTFTVGMIVFCLFDEGLNLLRESSQPQSNQLTLF